MFPRRVPRRALYALPYGLLAASAGIIAPVFVRGLPCSDDALPHLLRAVGFDFNLRAGAAFLQWGPDFMRGFGYPIFAFYAPLTYWLIEALHLAGLPFAGAFNALLLAALVVGGWGAYALARWWLPVPAAFAAGIAYLFAPYLLYDAIPRGALPETLALALLPFALLACLKAAARPTVRAVLAAGGLLALMQLSHNVVPLLAMAMALLLSLGEVNDNGAWRVRPLVRAAAPTALAVGVSLVLTAAFWVPSVVELQYTQSAVDLPADGPLRDWPRFYSHILPVRALLEWPPEPGDSRLLNPPVSRTLGVAQAALAAVGLLALAARPLAPLRRAFGLWALVLAGSLFLASTPSYWLWDHIGALSFIQLPTRFLGPASLALALLAGLGVHALSRAARPGWLAGGLLAAAVCGLSASGWPWLFPRYCPLEEPVTRAALVLSSDWERRQAESAGEVLPRWVTTLPDQNALLPDYLAGGPVNRLRWAEGAAALAAWQARPAHDRFEIEVSEAGEFTYQAFYFPGWQVRLDGRRLETRPTQPHGLIAFDVPAGRHALEIAFERTPLRRWTGLFSTAALLAAAVAWRRWPWPRASTTAGLVNAPAVLDGWWLAGAVAALWVAFFGVQARADSPLAADRLRTWQSGAHPAVFGGELALMGRRAAARIAAGQTLPVTLYWTALTDIGVPYGMAVRVVDDAGRVWSAGTHRPFGFADFPGTESWPLDAYARDAYVVALLAGTPPGTYWLEASVFRRDVTEALLPAAGLPTGRDPAYLRLGQVEVTGVQAFVDSRAAGVDVVAHTAMAPGLALVGWSVPGAALSSGDRAHLELLWQGTERQGTRRTATLELVAADGTVESAHTFPIGGERFPTDHWPRRSLARDQLDARLPPALPGGVYALRLTVSGGSSVALGHLTVMAPVRSFVSPAMAQPLAAEMGFARLTGFTLSGTPLRPAAPLTLDLAWAALAETETSYRVFIHLRDETGAVRAQADAVPLGWTRPTTGWLPGEFLLDTYTLTAPASLAAGRYNLVAGLYNPATGERLAEALVAVLETD